MKSSWVSGLPKDEAKELRADYNAGANLRERLATILKEKTEDQNRYGRGKDRYAQANWAYLQADICGYNRALAEILSLIE